MDIVDLTLTPKTEKEERQSVLQYQGDEQVISLLTPSSLSERSSSIPVHTRDDPVHDIKRCKKARQEIEEQYRHSNEKSKGGINSGTVSPITDAMRSYLANRFERKNTPIVINPTPMTPAKRSLSQRRPPSEKSIEKTVRSVQNLAIGKEIPSHSSRELIHQGDDTIVMELNENVAKSSLLSALIQQLSNAMKDQISICCTVRTGILPGRLCITWLQKLNKRENDCTHELFPYTIIILKMDMFVHEIALDRLETLLSDVTHTFPSSKVKILVVGFRDKIRKPLNWSQIEEWMADLFLNFKSLSFHVSEDEMEAMDHVIELSCAFKRIVVNKYDPSFLNVFGGIKSMESINTVDLKVSMASQITKRSSEKLLEWINLLHAIPGIGPKDAHGIALEYPSFVKLMDAYFSTSRSEEEKRQLFMDLKQPPENKRRIGIAASTALYEFFCNTRPNDFTSHD